MKHIILAMVFLHLGANAETCVNETCDILKLESSENASEGHTSGEAMLPKHIPTYHSTLVESTVLVDSELWRDQMLNAILQGATSSK